MYEFTLLIVQPQVSLLFDYNPQVLNQFVDILL